MLSEHLKVILLNYQKTHGTKKIALKQCTEWGIINPTPLLFDNNEKSWIRGNNMKKKCDVLYIHSIKNPLKEVKQKYNYMPVGIIGILNDLKNRGIQVIGINYGIEKEVNPDFNIDELLKSIEYKVLLTDLHWYEHSFGAMYVVKQSKNIKPKIPTVIGGYTSTIYAEEIIENFTEVDYIVTGDSDLPVRMLVDYLLKRNKVSLEDIPNLVYRQGEEKCKSTKSWVQTSLDEIDFVNTDCFEHEEYIPYVSTAGVNRKTSERWICIARGCKFNCAYCCGAKDNMKDLFGRCDILLRSPKKVALDFWELTEKNIYHISPSHDFQMFGKEYYKSVFEEIRKLNIKPGLYLECFQLPTKDFIDEMIKTFDKKRLILVISPISGNERVRKENGKIFSNDALYETVSYLLKNNIAMQLYYTENIYGETEEEFMDTYFQMKYLRMMFGLKKNQLFYQRIVIDPLAGMRKFKDIKVSYHSFMDYYNYCQSLEAQHVNAGFEDCGEVSREKKMELYEALFR